MSSGHLHPQYNLRWPEELRDKIAASAKKHNRSMNADIVVRLEQTFEAEEQFMNSNEENDHPLIQHIDKLIEAIEAQREIIEIQGETIKKQNKLFERFIVKTDKEKDPE